MELQRRSSKERTPAQEFASFLAKYSPGVRSAAIRALAKLRKLLPGAVELVYDNYNALAIGFAPSERASDVVLSIALYPRWVSLFFLHGASLPDPKRLLKGKGSRVRHLVLDPPSLLDTPPVRALIAAAVKSAPVPFARNRRRRMVIKSVSAQQRPRRPTR